MKDWKDYHVMGTNSKNKKDGTYQHCWEDTGDEYRGDDLDYKRFYGDEFARSSSTSRKVVVPLL